MNQRTLGRIESLHSEGVHECRYQGFLQRLSGMSCFSVSQLLMLGKSVSSNSSKVQDEDVDEDIANIDWPEQSVEKVKIIRTKAQSMIGYVEAVSNIFITGWFSSTSSLQLNSFTNSACKLNKDFFFLIQFSFGLENLTLTISSLNLLFHIRGVAHFIYSVVHCPR